MLFALKRHHPEKKKKNQNNVHFRIFKVLTDILVVLMIVFMGCCCCFIFLIIQESCLTNIEKDLTHYHKFLSAQPDPHKLLDSSVLRSLRQLMEVSYCTKYTFNVCNDISQLIQTDTVCCCLISLIVINRTASWSLRLQT